MWFVSDGPEGRGPGPPLSAPMPLQPYHAQGSRMISDMPRPSVRPPARPSERPSVRPSGSVRVRPGPSGSVRSVRSVRVRPDGLMMLITYVIHMTVDDHRSNRTRPARPARPARPGPSGPCRVRLARWVGLSNRGLLQSMPTLQIPQCTLCTVIHWGTSNISEHGQPLVLVRS